MSIIFIGKLVRKVESASGHESWAGCPFEVLAGETPTLSFLDPQLSLSICLSDHGLVSVRLVLGYALYSALL
jgi:hypothetical protein